MSKQLRRGFPLNSRGKRVGLTQTPRLIDANHQTKFLHHKGLADGIANPSCKSCHGTKIVGHQVHGFDKKDAKGKVLEKAHRVPITCACVIRQAHEVKNGGRAPWQKNDPPSEVLQGDEG